VSLTQSAGLPLSATLLVIVAAVAHASWNAIVHVIEDKTVALILINGWSALLALPVVFLAPLPDRSSWPWLIGSVVVHLGYMLLLVTAYRLGDFSQTYPIARGSAPLIVTVLAAVFVGELPQPVELAGVVVVSVGLASLVFAAGIPGRREVPAVLAALATGGTIATYTVLDGTGVRSSGTVAGYIGWLMLLSSLTTLGVVAARRRRTGRLLQLRRHAGVGLIGAVLSLAAYGLVLWAQTKGALAPVSALRETSIVIGAIIGAVLFKEGFGPRRIIATAVVFAGVLLINLA
jgi:drug/metabolite transporter (DMT)-like permease